MTDITKIPISKLQEKSNSKVLIKRKIYSVGSGHNKHSHKEERETVFYKMIKEARISNTPRIDRNKLKEIEKMYVNNGIDIDKL